MYILFLYWKYSYEIILYEIFHPTKISCYTVHYNCWAICCGCYILDGSNHHSFDNLWWLPCLNNYYYAKWPLTLLHTGVVTFDLMQCLLPPQLSSSSSSSSSLVLEPHGERLLLRRSGALEVDKNSDVVKALVRANPTYASAAISSMLGIGKDDTCEPSGAGGGACCC